MPSPEEAHVSSDPIVVSATYRFGRDPDMPLGMPDFDIMPPGNWRRLGPPPGKPPREPCILEPCACASSIEGGEVSATSATSAVGTTSASRDTARMSGV